MWHYLDLLLIVVIVLISGAYAVYALGSVKLKRTVLTLLVRMFGARVFSVFSPRLTGCSNCSAGDSRADLLRKLNTHK
jgi:hypothetical protein